MYNTIGSISTAITRKKPLTPLSSPKQSPKPHNKSNKSGSGSSSTGHGGQGGVPTASSNSESKNKTTEGTTVHDQDSASSDSNHSNHSTSTSAKLQRTLGVMDLIFYGIGCSVGAGIYSLVGLGAQTAGPAISLSFALCGIACCFTSLSYAEFAARVPLAGSAYTFTYVSFGELAGWLVGWNLTLGYAVSAAAVSRSWAVYVSQFVQGLFPKDSSSATTSSSSSMITVLDTILQWLVKAPLPYYNQQDCCLLAAIVIILCTIVLIKGAKESTKFNTIMTILNLSVLGFVVVAGLVTGSVRLDNLGLSSSFSSLFASSASSESGELSDSSASSASESSFFGTNGFDGVGRAAGLVFFSYLGFDMVSCLSEEVINPERNMPIGIVGSLISSTVIYVVVSLVVVGMVPIALLGEDIPIVNCMLANACCTHEEQLQDVMIHQNENAADNTNHPFDCLSYSSCQQTAAAAVDDGASSFSHFHFLVLFMGSKIISVGAIFGLTTATFACLMGQPRIFYSMAQDGLLFEIYGRIDPHTGVPTAGTILTGLMTATVACFIDLESLANTISLGTLMVFTFVNAGIIVLRTTPPTPTPTVTTDDEMIDVDENRNNNNNNSHDMLPTNERSSLITTSHRKTMYTNENENENQNKNKKCCGRRSCHLLPDEGGIMTIKQLQQSSRRSSSTASFVSISPSPSTSMSTTNNEHTPTRSNATTSTTSVDVDDGGSGGVRRDAMHNNSNGLKPYWCTFLFTISAVLLSTGFSRGWPLPLVLLFLLVLVVSTGVLFRLQLTTTTTTTSKSKSNDAAAGTNTKNDAASTSFQCPFVSAVPLLGILCNSYMMGSMPSSTWFVIMIWLMLGLGFYFTYGIHHSKLQK